MNSFVITTQFLENYGAHCESGKFADGNHFWKMKGGSDFLVTGLDRIQDAVAFVAALRMENNLHGKEFPVSWKSYDEWKLGLPEDDEYREYIMENLQEVSPE